MLIYHSFYFLYAYNDAQIITMTYLSIFDRRTLFLIPINQHFRRRISLGESFGEYATSKNSPRTQGSYSSNGDTYLRPPRTLAIATRHSWDDF